jgi:hypothetical protein
MAARKKLVNTIGWNENQLQNIASKKPELSIVGSEISRNKGTKKIVYK